MSYEAAGWQAKARTEARPAAQADVAPEAAQLSRLYEARFEATGLAKRRGVWRVLTRHFFQRYVAPEATVLDVACGYGEFINNIAAARKFAIDLNPDAADQLATEVRFVCTPATDLSALPQGEMDVVFTSNFLEHFRDKRDLDGFLREVHGVMKPGGRFIILGPNIRFAFREYWDFYDHHLALSDRSLVEALAVAGFATEQVIPRFLPFTMNNRAPTRDWLIRTYLRLPLAWRLFGKQFLVVARKPT